MEENGQDKILSFDTLYTNNHIQKLKILCSYLDPNAQLKIAVYIKLMELQYTLAITNRLSFSNTSFSFPNNIDISHLCREMIPFCDQKEQEKLLSLQNMYQNFENIQEMMQMAEMMKDFMPTDFTQNSQMGDINLSQILNMMNGGQNESGDTPQMDE